MAAIGALLNAALYLVSVFGMALLLRHDFPALAAIASMGTAALGYSFQLQPVPRWALMGMTGLSQVLAIVAGVSLIVACMK